ncbi:hypothetical protein IAU60_002706 [Kwoniella sp. DSM 27419]
MSARSTISPSRAPSHSSTVSPGASSSAGPGYWSPADDPDYTYTTSYARYLSPSYTASTQGEYASPSASGSGYAGQYILSSDTVVSSAAYAVPTGFTTYVSGNSTWSSAPSGWTSNSTAAQGIVGQSNGNGTVAGEVVGQSSGHVGPLSLPAVIAIAVIATLTAVGGCLGCCLYRRRRRRLNTLPGPGENRRGNRKSRRSSRGRQVEGDKWTEIDVSPLPSPATSGPRLSPCDLRQSVLSRHQADIHRSPSSTSPGVGISPANLVFDALSRPWTAGRAGSRRSESTYTDNTEYDMLAQDGSSYARTLSTYSEGVNSEYSVRDLGYAPPLSAVPSSGGRRVGGSSQGDVKDPNGPGLSPSSGSTGTWQSVTTPTGRTHLSNVPMSRANTVVHQANTPTTASRPILSLNTSPFADPQLDPISLPTASVTQTSHIAYPHNPAPSPAASGRSWRTEDETLFGDHSSRFASRVDGVQADRGQSLTRGLTIVRHTDGGAAFTPTRSRMAVSEEDEADSAMHLPPSYGDLYGRA